jgi:hypothetical protein
MDKTDKYLIIFLINTIIISLVCLSPVHGEVYLIQLYVIKFVRSPVSENCFPKVAGHSY